MTISGEGPFLLPFHAAVCDYNVIVFLHVNGRDDRAK
jgi:hypothetical protein